MRYNDDMLTDSRRQIRFNVDEYLRIADAGLLGRRRTELLEGRIIKLAPQKDPHMGAISRLNALLMAVADPKRDWLIVQGTLYLDEQNAPDPDFQLYDVPIMTPLEKRPKPLLVVEVSHTTYRRDSEVKTRIYARNGIEDYWIVDVRKGRVEVYRQPFNPTGKDEDWGYKSATSFGPGESVTMLKRPTVSFRVEDMLP
jgi:Uma2 family endonuclease